MSHFTVLVIGGNIADQLQPYHEFESTGCNDQYVQNVDQTAEVASLVTRDEPMSLQEALEYYGLEDRVVSDESEVQSAGNDAPHMYGYAVVKDGQLVKAVKRTNPNKKWDWYTVGGRWGGTLKLKAGAPGFRNQRGKDLAQVSGGYADMANKGCIDIDGMRADAAREAGERWDKARAATGGQSWKPWSQVRGDHPDNIDEARNEYGAQPAYQALRKVFDSPFHSLDQYLTGRDEFVQRASDSALSAYAVLCNGQWAAKGEMGWFGMSDDKLSESEWVAKVNEMIDRLPDDALLTVVDCHI